jgi:alkylated DNA repair dioxygenase AlkB
MAQLQMNLGDTVSDAVFPIAGLTYIPDYITADDAGRLLRYIDDAPWIHDLKRRVQHYGYRYDYKARNITKDSQLGPPPDWLLPLCNQLHADGYFSRVPDQVIVNEYMPRQGIAAHTDCVPCFGGVIASLSLGTACVMDFTQPQPERKVPVLLEPESLIILSGDARYVWRHSIAPRKTDRINGTQIRRGRRVSLTFRSVILSGEAT